MNIFDKGNKLTYGNDPDVAINRAKLIDFCYGNHFVIANTFFEKSDGKLVTIKKQGTKPPFTFERPNFDTVDYWLVQQ